jgi:hypothetical protein
MLVSTGKSLASAVNSPLELAGSVVRPTKLFIGGISRHTSTKNLRDHFSQYGRVLDCVAMRQPDGRSRGFGYVTLDSPAAAQCCLSQPQVIDGRIVDMKAAVPEVSKSAKAGDSTCDEPQSSTESEGVSSVDRTSCVTPNSWTEVRDDATDPQWRQSYGNTSNNIASEASHRGSQNGTPAHCVRMLHGGRQTFQDVFDSTKKSSLQLSMNAPEFIPMLVGKSKVSLATDPMDLPLASSSPASLAVQAREKPKPLIRTPLGEVTNTQASLQGAECLKHDNVVDLKSFCVSKPIQLRRDRPAIIEIDWAPENVELDTALPKPRGYVLESTKTSPKPSIGDFVGSSDFLEPGKSITDGEAAEAACSSLPSAGSRLHSVGECRRCNFFSKGRCQNGKDCVFCHLPHEKRKPSRQEKRERQAAWQQRQFEKEQALGQGCDPQKLQQPALAEDSNDAADEEDGRHKSVQRCEESGIADVSIAVEAASNMKIEVRPEVELPATSGIPAFLDLAPFLQTAALATASQGILPPGLPFPSALRFDVLPPPMHSQLPMSLPWQLHAAKSELQTPQTFLATSPSHLSCATSKFAFPATSLYTANVA